MAVCGHCMVVTYTMLTKISYTMYHRLTANGAWQHLHGDPYKASHKTTGDNLVFEFRIIFIRNQSPF